jgi:hypothetical protein
MAFLEAPEDSTALADEASLGDPLLVEVARVEVVRSCYRATACVGTRREAHLSAARLPSPVSGEALTPVRAGSTTGTEGS